VPASKSEQPNQSQSQSPNLSLSTSLLLTDVGFQVSVVTGNVTNIVTTNVI